VIRCCTRRPHPLTSPVQRLCMQGSVNLRHRLMQLAVATRLALSFRRQAQMREISIAASAGPDLLALAGPVSRRALGLALAARATEAARDIGGREFSRSPKFI
jgi:hypothetical protein